ncbi:hypothetical protein [uncultured Clostridium sp.]|uniref:hypothetical protein n=1 Tax=uncultured Clostridium sp. TaxID=59620 RepID=UPI00272EDCCF|nr:hypothetical protein [uncultured Clostridium sp.]
MIKPAMSQYSPLPFQIASMIVKIVLELIKKDSISTILILSYFSFTALAVLPAAGSASPVGLPLVLG